MFEGSDDRHGDFMVVKEENCGKKKGKKKETGGDRRKTRMK